MVKKIDELNKKEKLLLLKAIAEGQVDKSRLNENTLICIEKGDMFLGMMIAGSQVDENTSLDVICIGEARKAENTLFDNIHT